MPSVHLEPLDEDVVGLERVVRVARERRSSGDAATTWAFAVVATPSSAQLPIAHHLPAASASAAMWQARIRPPASDG